MSEFRMPSLGADMDAATLIEWSRRPGDTVQRGDVIAVVETQKGAIEIETFESGVLDKICVQVGEKVPVGTVLAYIRAAGEAGAPVATVPAPPVKTPEPVPVAAPVEVPPVMAGRAAARISPAARTRAAAQGIDLTAVAPGADGIIGLRELDATVPAVAAPAGAPAAPSRPAGTGVDRVEMRRAIAAAMQRSWQEIPHYFVTTTIDMEPLLRWLAQTNAERALPERRHYAAPLIRAVARALRATPALNGHYVDGQFQPGEAVHLGIAVALRGGGLIAPAMLDTDQLDLDGIMQHLNDLVARVRGGRLRSSEMTAATATLTNLGEETADALQPIIYPPQVAIIGCGQIRERAWAEHDTLSARRTMTVTVGGDHRVSDGRVAAKFLRHLEHLLTHPDLP